jgi:hypothetical protein
MRQIRVKKYLEAILSDSCLPHRYDSRVLHRGLANVSNTPRPVLVYRYDKLQYPPPQAGLVQTTFMRALGYMLSCATSL